MSTIDDILGIPSTRNKNDEQVTNITENDIKFEIFGFKIWNGDYDWILYYAFSYLAAALVFFGFVSLSIFIFKNFVHPPENPSAFVAVIAGSGILTIIISLLVAIEVRKLSESLMYNIISPCIEPLLPFFKTKAPFRICVISLSLGKFFSDILTFLIILYLIFRFMTAFDVKLSELPEFVAGVSGRGRL